MNFLTFQAFSDELVKMSAAPPVAQQQYGMTSSQRNTQALANPNKKKKENTPEL